MKFILQGKRVCRSCKREVDLVSRDTEPGVLMSRHLIPHKSVLQFCPGSLADVKEQTWSR